MIEETYQVINITSNINKKIDDFTMIFRRKRLVHSNGHSTRVASKACQLILKKIEKNNLEDKTINISFSIKTKKGKIVPFKFIKYKLPNQ